MTTNARQHAPQDSALPIARRHPWNRLETFESLLASAEQALRGGTVTGPFSGLADARLRRRLASELMLTSGPIEFGWKKMFQATQLISVDDPTSRFDVMSVEDTMEEEPSDFEVVNRSCTPRCWLRFTDITVSLIQRRRNRQQAAKAFPFLVALAVLVAHSEEPWLRVHAAWSVIDAIDEGRPLLVALSGFLQVGQAAVRVGRHIPVMPWDLHATWPGVRRILRAIVQLPPQWRPRSLEEWTRARWFLPWLAVLAEGSNGILARVFPLTPELMDDLTCLASWRVREWRRVLRAASRSLGCEGAAGWSRISTGLFAFLPSGTISWYVAVCKRIVLTTPGGWQARSIITAAELSQEGEEMEHCVAALHTQDLLDRTATIFSIRSAGEQERLTLVVSRYGESTVISMRAAGPDNIPATYAGLHAVLQVAQTLWPACTVEMLSIG